MLRDLLVLKRKSARGKPVLSHLMSTLGNVQIGPVRLTDGPSTLPKSARADLTLPSREGGEESSPIIHIASAPLPDAARVAFREGEAAGTIEILSFDAAGACTVHKVGGLALGNLLVLAAQASRRGMA